MSRQIITTQTLSRHPHLTRCEDCGSHVDPSTGECACPREQRLAESTRVCRCGAPTTLDGICSLFKDCPRYEARTLRRRQRERLVARVQQRRPA